MPQRALHSCRGAQANFCCVIRDIGSPRLLSECVIRVRRGPAGEQFDALKQYLDNGGAVLMMLAEGGEKELGTNVDFLLEQYGVSVNSDSVIRTVYYKYHHPKVPPLLGCLNTPTRLLLNVRHFVTMQIAPGGIHFKWRACAGAGAEKGHRAADGSAPGDGSKGSFGC